MLRRIAYNLALLTALTMTANLLRGQSPTKEQIEAWEIGEDKKAFAGHPAIALYVWPQENPVLDITKDVELALRRNGIPIIGPTECFPRALNCGELYVNIDVLRVSKDVSIYAAQITVKYSEWMLPTRNRAAGPVKLERTNVDMVEVTRWQPPSGVALGIVGEAKLSSIRDLALEQVDRFCLAYLRANPPKQLPPVR
jgi:hypothetical protein